MTHQRLSSMVLIIAGLTVSAEPGLSSQPPPAEAGPKSEAAAPQTRPAEQIDVEEAIRRAVEALDALEAVEKSDEREALSDRANRYIEIIEASDPNNPWLAYLYGRVYAHLGRRGEAVQQLRKFVETRPGRNEWSAYRTLGDLFVDGFPQLAQANYQKALALKANEPAILSGLAQCAGSIGSTKEAIRFARAAVAADGGRTTRYVAQLATLLRNAGNGAEALEQAERALARAREEVRAKPGAREPLMAIAGYDELVVKILEDRVNTPDHQDHRDYLRLAACLRERGDITQKLALHDVLLTIEAGVAKTAPNTPPELLQELGVILAQVGRTEDAVGVFERLLEADPENAAAREWLSQLRPSEPDASGSPSGP